MPPFLFSTRLAAALVLTLLSAGETLAQRVCIEEVAGVCLRYGGSDDAARARQPASPEAVAEARLRMSAEERKSVQRGLGALGYYDGAVDAAFGAGTRRAIARWQTDEGRAATGFLTLGELRALTAAKPTAEPQPQPQPQVAAPEPEPALSPPPEPEPAVEPVVAEPTKPEPPKVDHPVSGRLYSHEYDMASIAKYTITVEREGAQSARVYLIADNGDSGFRKSCVVALTGPFECWLGGRGWQPKRIFGALPEITLDLASGSPGGNVHRFWD